MSFWEGFFLASLIWVIVCFFAFLRGMDWSFDHRMNWSDGFNSGWDAAMEIAEKKGEQKNG